MTLEELIECTEVLPPAPEILIPLLKIMQDPNMDSANLVSLISTDPAIVAGTLKVCNSALYSPASPVTNMAEAVALLGFKELYRIVNLVTTGSILEGSLSSMEIHRGGLQRHSLAVALMMDLISKERHTFDGFHYTLGLLHDIGKLAIHHGCGEKYVSVFKSLESEQITISEAEKRTFGFDHAQAGSKILEHWGFPPEVCLPILFQYNPNEADDFRELAGCLQVANWAAAAIGCNEGRDAWALKVDTDCFHIEERDLELAILDGRSLLEHASVVLEHGVN